MVKNSQQGTDMHITVPAVKVEKLTKEIKSNHVAEVLQYRPADSLN